MKHSWCRATVLQKELFLSGHGFQKLFLSQRCKATAFHYPVTAFLVASPPDPASPQESTFLQSIPPWLQALLPYAKL